MKTTLDNFYKKWNGKYLDDMGAYMSKEYNAYQNSLNRCMRAIAKDLGAEVVSFTKGHYFESIVFHRNGHYVYLHHEDLNRTYINLKNDGWCRPWYIRTMAHATDWRGGVNEFNFNWNNLKETIDKFLNMVHYSPF